jgi:hypothetical protein
MKKDWEKKETCSAYLSVSSKIFATSAWVWTRSTSFSSFQNGVQLIHYIYPAFVPFARGRTRTLTNSDIKRNRSAVSSKWNKCRIYVGDQLDPALERTEGSAFKKAHHHYWKLINYALTWARPNLFLFIFMPVARMLQHGCWGKFLVMKKLRFWLTICL